MIYPHRFQQEVQDLEIRSTYGLQQSLHKVGLYLALHPLRENSPMDRERILAMQQAYLAIHAEILSRHDVIDCDA